MKGIVVYKGKYGATAQYAAWLGEALYLPVYNLDKQFIDRLANYDYIMIGSPVYVGKLLIKSWLREHEALLKGKKTFLFIVNGSATEDEARQTAILEDNVPLDLLPAAKTFFLPGRVVINKLSWFDKLVIRIGAFMEHDPVKKQLMRKGFDGVKREHINKMIKEALHYSNAEILP